MRRFGYLGILPPPTDSEIASARDAVNNAAQVFGNAQTAMVAMTCHIQGVATALPAVHCNPSLTQAVTQAANSLRQAQERYQSLQQRKADAASSPAEAEAARREVQSSADANRNLTTSHQDMLAATTALTRAATNPADLVRATANLAAAAERTALAAKAVQDAVNAERKKSTMIKIIVGTALAAVVGGLAFYLRRK